MDFGDVKLVRPPPPPDHTHTHTQLPPLVNNAINQRGKTEMLYTVQTH